MKFDDVFCGGDGEPLVEVDVEEERSMVNRISAGVRGAERDDLGDAPPIEGANATIASLKLYITQGKQKIKAICKALAESSGGQDQILPKDLTESVTSVVEVVVKAAEKAVKQVNTNAQMKIERPIGSSQRSEFRECAPRVALRARRNGDGPWDTAASSWRPFSLAGTPPPPF